MTAHGPSDVDARTAIARLLDAAGLPLEHDAERYGTVPEPPDDAEALEPCDQIAFVTIDGPDSRDLDQALHVAREPAGFRLRYAIADAAAVVRPERAPLWDAALSRGATLYAPERAIPMLPPELSEDRLSLVPGERRRALLFDMTVRQDGTVSHCRVYRAWIRSRLQLTYDGVQAFADGRGSLDDARAPQPRSLAVVLSAVDAGAVTASLEALAPLGEALETARLARGVIPFERAESAVEIAGEPPRFRTHRRERLDVERWNEQLSLACNLQGAALLEAFEADEPMLEPIFRVHDAPEGSRRRDLDATLHALADTLQLEGPWRRQRKTAETAGAWFARLPDEAPRLKRAIQRQLLRAQSASRYTDAVGRHHALAADGYARFSSPMREIVGVHTHLVLLDAIGLQRSPAARDPALRDAVIAAAEASRQRQKALERGVHFAVLSELFSDDLAADDAPWHDGTLVGVDSRKLHVALDRFALDVKVYLEDLMEMSDRDWTLDAVSATASDASEPAYVLGDGVRVRVVRFDPVRERWALAIRPMGARKRPGRIAGGRGRRRAGGRRA